MQISKEMWRVYEALKAGGNRWQTSNEICKSGANPRTARANLRRLTGLGLADCRTDLHPGYRYRMPESPVEEAKRLASEIEDAGEVYSAE